MKGPKGLLASLALFPLILPHPLHNTPIANPTTLPHMRAMSRPHIPLLLNPQPPFHCLHRMSFDISPPDHGICFTVDIAPSLFSLRKVIQCRTDPENRILKEAKTDGDEVDADKEVDEKEGWEVDYEGRGRKGRCEG